LTKVTEVATLFVHDILVSVYSVFTVG